MNSSDPGSPPSSPPSPTSTSSEGSLSGKMGNLSISSQSETTKSKEVNWFTVLFNQSTPDEQKFYIDEFFKYMPQKNLLRKNHHIQKDDKKKMRITV